ncbi:MAG: hypothetical protein BGN83_00145 [Rhizobium sp. 63-7]|nr:MAG: hypothetical protein BGN83_00145 [Rhizobium sp. 63-7]
MTVVHGLDLSFLHNQNGMTKSDMLQCSTAATNLNEVIIFRSTGPWAKRWIERGYPTKNFHVKGKSSDWGPHAGLVPYDGTYSKVGYDREKAKKGTEANDDGIRSGFAGKTTLVLSREQIAEQDYRAEGRPPRTALMSVAPVPGSDNLTLSARRSGDGLQVIFLARKRQDGRYDILVYPTLSGTDVRPVTQLASKGLVSNSVFLAQDRDKNGASSAIPLEVMTSLEIGAGQPMTGDYDLFAVCPTWGDYGSQSSREISKPGISLMNGRTHDGLSYAAGVGMDNVLDARLATGGTAAMDFKNRAAAYRNTYANNLGDTTRKWVADGHGGYRRGGLTTRASEDTYKMIFMASKYGEHGDMGNLTPRILRCINTLNGLMGATGERGALRRVHHNAESHRFRLFGALTATDMVTKKDGEEYGDGFPLTVFQPLALQKAGKPASRYGDVCTLETLQEFQAYAMALAGSGYYVPKNWVWNMHVSPAARAGA